MASIDNLPPDQRAVLQLVLQRGRSYDDIAQLLSIDRAAVRQRALAAFDALGPQTGVASEERALITDYLLGQLPPRVADSIRERIGGSPSERAWARVVASELAGFASHELPEIPVEAASAREPGPPAREPAPRRRREREPAPPVAAAAAAAAADTDTASRPVVDVGTPRDSARPASRRGGALLLALGGVVAIVVAVVLIILLSGGGSNKSKTTAGKAASTTTSKGSTHLVGQVNLISPTAAKAAGIAEVLKQGTLTGVAIIASNMTPNTRHNAYAVWLSNSASDAHLLGFVNPGVGKNGRLSTQGSLPTNAAHYKDLIITLETQAHPKQPGTIVLEGQLASVHLS